MDKDQIMAFLSSMKGGTKPAENTEVIDLSLIHISIVPFKDDFPKNTQLYRIMTTKPEETVQN